MATLSLQSVTTAGSTITPVAAAGGGDAMPTGPKNMLRVVNGGGSPITVTVTSVQACSQGGTHSISAVSVTNGTTKEFGPITSRFADSTGLAQITYSGVTSVTVAAYAVADS